MIGAARPVLVWAVLTAATAAGWWIGTGHGVPGRAAAALVVVIAFSKIHVVGREFMELRHAPPALRWAFYAWVALAGGICLFLVAF